MSKADIEQIDMLDEEDYSKLIKLGADKIRKW